MLLEAARDSVPRGVPAGADRDSAILAVGVYAGLRVSELAHLDRLDVDLQDLTVQVRQGKGGKDRVVPLHLNAAIAVETYLSSREDSEPALFLSRRGTRISVRALRDVVYRTARAAALSKRIHPHTLRHTFGTLLADRGADLQVIQELLGHASLTTTTIYMHMSAARSRSAIDRL